MTAPHAPVRPVWIARLLTLVPDPLRQDIKIFRAVLCETAGIRRFSHPSLNGLDQLVARYLPAGPGTFLEIGANNGYSQSNTYHLERVLGWRGVLVEPIPRLARRCRWIRRRSEVFNVACVGRSGPDELLMASQGLVSVALGLQRRATEQARVRPSSRTVEVRTRTLSSVIDESSFDRIDFISVDVEGTELEVLAGLELDRHCPSVLLVETDQPEAVAAALSPQLTLAARLTHHDYLFLASAS